MASRNTEVEAGALGSGGKLNTREAGLGCIHFPGRIRTPSPTRGAGGWGVSRHLLHPGTPAGLGPPHTHLGWMGPAPCLLDPRGSSHPAAEDARDPELGGHSILGTSEPQEIRRSPVPSLGPPPPLSSRPPVLRRFPPPRGGAVCGLLEDTAQAASFGKVQAGTSIWPALLNTSEGPGKPQSPDENKGFPFLFSSSP